jgi:hypothetical protein
MNLRPITDLADLARLIAQDELPVPARVEWKPLEGLRVNLLAEEVDAWLRVARGTRETALAATEERIAGFIFWDTPRLIDDLPVILHYSVPVDPDTWRISNSSQLSYEEAAEWLKEWQTGEWTDEQRIREWTEARDKYGVPEACLPELDLADAS